MTPSALELVSLVLTLGVLCVQCYPQGAPHEACITMLPTHGVQPQISPTPYTLITGPLAYSHGPATSINTVNVSLSLQGALSFKGVMIQARSTTSSAPLGRWIVIPPEMQLINCSGAYDTVTHIDRGIKWSAMVTWEVNSWEAREMSFIATVVHNETMFWTDIRSHTITFDELVVEPTEEPRSEIAVFSDALVTTVMISGAYIGMYFGFSLLLI